MVEENESEMQPWTSCLQLRKVRISVYSFGGNNSTHHELIYER